MEKNAKMVKDHGRKTEDGPRPDMGKNCPKMAKNGIWVMFLFFFAPFLVRNGSYTGPQLA